MAEWCNPGKVNLDGAAVAIIESNLGYHSDIHCTQFALLSDGSVVCIDDVSAGDGPLPIVDHWLVSIDGWCRSRRPPVGPGVADWPSPWRPAAYGQSTWLPIEPPRRYMVEDLRWLEQYERERSE